MKLVIIESPYRGEVERNKLYLRSCIRDCIMRGESPYAWHRMLTDALDDDDPKERMLGIETGLAWRSVMKPTFSKHRPDLHIGNEMAVHAFYVDLGWSDGMLYAKKRYDDERLLYEERKLPEDDPFFFPMLNVKKEES